MATVTTTIEKPSIEQNLASSETIVAPSQKQIKNHGEIQEDYHKIAFTAITALAFLTRFCGISYPSDLVFDEAHTIRFLSWYIDEAYFFDLHPPLGRLIFLAACKLLGWKGGYYPDDCGDSFVEKGVPYVPLRMLAASFSVASVSLVYLTLWEAGCGVPACLVAAGLMVLDNAHIAHERLIYLDGMVCFFIIASFYSYLRFRRQPAWTMSWWTWLSLTGLALCCIMSTKMVGLFTYTAIGIYTVLELWSLFDLRSGHATSLVNLVKHVLARFVAWIALPLCLYLLFFWIHLKILWKTGSGDDYHEDRFVLTLKGNILSGDRVLPWAFLPKFWELFKEMLHYGKDVGVGDNHPFETRAYHWLFPTRGVSFWCSDETREQIFFTGNLPGWWIAGLSTLAFVVIVIADQISEARGLGLLGQSKRRQLFGITTFLFLGWLTHYAPFFLMRRQLMMHSYLPAHMLSTMVTGSLVDFLDHDIRHGCTQRKTTKSEAAKTASTDPEVQRDSSFSAWLICWLILTPVFLFWWYWAPLTYGQPFLSPQAVERREIFDVVLNFSPTYNQATCRK